MKHLQKIVVMVVAVVLAACDSYHEVINTDRGFDYLPLSKGVYQIYDVEEVVYELGDEQTFTYQLKTSVADSFPNAEGNYTYVIYRSKLNPATNTWEPLNTWSVRTNKTEAIRYEENIPYVVLNFPPASGRSWDGNVYNNKINPNTNENSDEYEIISAGQSFTIGTESFSDCLVVNHEEYEDYVVYYDKRFEVYAKKIGLIYVERTELSFCTDDNCLGQQKIENGIKYKQSLRTYGKE